MGNCQSKSFNPRSCSKLFYHVILSNLSGVGQTIKPTNFIPGASCLNAFQFDDHDLKDQINFGTFAYTGGQGVSMVPHGGMQVDFWFIDIPKNTPGSQNFSGAANLAPYGFRWHGRLFGACYYICLP